MKSNNNARIQSQQEYSQAAIREGKVSKKESCKDFHKFLKGMFSAYKTLGP